ncbi:MAG: hypothetical protein V7L25_33505 [Nostoc sp.]|uniref:hypothetical protein n=1 Tax=Nostoc sp. TaxID=1180 RepID=UPI002FF31378
MKFNQLLTATYSFTALSVVMQLPTPAFAQNPPNTCACVTSGATPQPGQKERSSGNFSTQGCASTLIVTAPGATSFDIKYDISGGPDGPALTNQTNNSIFLNPNARNLYIANPKSAPSGNITICFVNKV